MGRLFILSTPLEPRTVSHTGHRRSARLHPLRSPGWCAAAVAVHLAVVEEVAWRVGGRVFRQREAVVATVCALAVSWHWLQGWGVGFLAHASIIAI